MNNAIQRVQDSLKTIFLFFSQPNFSTCDLLILFLKKNWRTMSHAWMYEHRTLTQIPLCEWAGLNWLKQLLFNTWIKLKIIYDQKVSRASFIKHTLKVHPIVQFIFLSCLHIRSVRNNSFWYMKKWKYMLKREKFKIILLTLQN